MSKIKGIGIALLVSLTAIFLTILFGTGRGIEYAKLDASTPPSIEQQFLDEGVKLLQEVLKIPTIRGNERAVLDLFAEYLNNNGISATILPYKNNPSRGILMAEFKSASENPKPGIIYANHVDVVEADPKVWSVPPFSGAIKDGRIFGRGAIDMKGMAVMQLLAFVWAKKTKIKLDRPLMFLALPDEESGSGGAIDFVTHHKDLLKGYKFLVNEGGLGTDSVAVPGSKVFNLQYSEKGSLWFTAKAKGMPGHGSSPPPRYATLDLINFLQELKSLDNELEVTEETSSFFYQLGTISKFPKSFFLKRAAHPLITPILKGPIKSNRHLSAMTSNTRSITGLSVQGASGINVIPGEASGRVDMRLLPNVDPKEFEKKLRRLADKHDVEIKVVEAKKASKSDLDSVMFKTLAAVAVKNVPGSVVAPLMSPGLTDNSVFRPVGLECYGLIPGLFNSSDLNTMHGIDESITIDNFKLGTKILFETVYYMNR